MQVSKSFKLVEFIPPEVHITFGDNAVWFIDKKTVELAQFIRDYFSAPMTINNWHTGGQFKERGYRVPGSKTGQIFSQHKFGRAFDFNIKDLTANQVRAIILRDPEPFLKAGLTTIEDETYSPTWVHADIRWNFARKNILIVKPAEINALSTDEYFTWEEGEFVPTQLPKFLGK